MYLASITFSSVLLLFLKLFLKVKHSIKSSKEYIIIEIPITFVINTAPSNGLNIKISPHIIITKDSIIEEVAFDCLFIDNA